jgi:hypothetical protein
MTRISFPACCRGVATFLVLVSQATAALAYDATVTVDASQVRATIPTTAYGIHTSVYDNLLNHAHVPARLGDAGITVLRYPGGGYADVYHWSENRTTQFRNSGDRGYIATNADFGRFARMVQAVRNGKMMITVNYGSSLQGDSGGEPREAAAWVAYCNGAAANAQLIGVDSRGNDWRTVGYWAALRGATPLATDDGRNFLRIGHTAPLGCPLWEIGNEVFANGFFKGMEFESDWHAGYGGERAGIAALSPNAVGNNVRAFVAAMKAVDPTIQIGIPVSTPPYDDKWGVAWDEGMLRACGDVIQFIAIHDYVGNYAPPDWKAKDAADVLAKSGPDRIAEIVGEAHKRVEKYAGPHAAQIQIAITEANARPLPPDHEWANALFAANVYAGFLENGIMNVDWLELHNGTFLSADTGGTPNPPYYAIQLVSKMFAPGDAAVKTLSSNSLLDTHAAKKASGAIALLLINTSPRDSANARVNLAGFLPQATGTMHSLDLGTGQLTTRDLTGLGDSFAIEVPAYSIRELLLRPAAARNP